MFDFALGALVGALVMLIVCGLLVAVLMWLTETGIDRGD